MKSRLLLIFLLFSFCIVTNSKVISNDDYNYELIVDESCDVDYEEGKHSVTTITSPDGMSVFYIVCTKTGNFDTVFSNDVLETFDTDFFDDLNQKPTRTESYFWFSKEDHYYTFEDGSILKTRVLLWNDKAGMLAGYSLDGDMEFIEKCMNDFKSPIALGKIATLIYLIIFLILFCIGIGIWSDNKFYAILYFLVFIAGWYYFHWVLDISVNQFVLSWFS